MKKQYRIKKNEEFDVLIKANRKFVSDFFSVYYNKRTQNFARFGISVSKKVANAVIRNKIKRQMRMIIMQSVDFEKFPFDCIVIIRKKFLDNDYKTNKNNFENSIKKCKIK